MIRGNRGFTLVELLITVVIIAILTAIAIPAYITVVSNAQDSAAKQTLSSAASAQHLYSTSPASLGQFTDVAGLSTAGLIKFNDPSKIQIAYGSQCFVAAALSDTGKTFYITSQNETPTTTDPGSSCATLPAFGAATGGGGGGGGGTAAPAPTDTSNILAYTIDTTAPKCGLAYSSPINSAVNATVDWGDGTSTQATTADFPSHGYATAGVYAIVVTGTFQGFGGLTYPNRTACTTAVTKWGSATGTTSAYSAFRFATKLTSVVSPPATITNMGGMFYAASAFNQPLNFNTTNVTNMASMFSLASAFNQPLTFDTANVTDMTGMLNRASAFNQPLNFNTTKVTTMQSMFASASAFNQPLNFNTTNVTLMAYMFYNSSAFNQNIKLWSVAKVTDHSYFRDGSALTTANSPF